VPKPGGVTLQRERHDGRQTAGFSCEAPGDAEGSTRTARRRSGRRRAAPQARGDRPGADGQAQLGEACEDDHPVTNMRVGFCKPLGHGARRAVPPERRTRGHGGPNRGIASRAPAPNARQRGDDSQTSGRGRRSVPSSTLPANFTTSSRHQDCYQNRIGRRAAWRITGKLVEARPSPSRSRTFSGVQVCDYTGGLKLERDEGRSSWQSQALPSRVSDRRPGTPGSAPAAAHHLHGSALKGCHVGRGQARRRRHLRMPTCASRARSSSSIGSGCAADWLWRDGAGDSERWTRMALMGRA